MHAIYRCTGGYYHYYGPGEQPSALMKLCARSGDMDAILAAFRLLIRDPR